MQSGPQGELHLHAALAGKGQSAAPIARKRAVGSAASKVSLLRLSVPARLLIVAFASALLWGGVLWALQ